ncbi:oligosaccharide flippase family protein [Colwellia sp. BRX8-9]|uniref:oligosaccharide flippase family protein n=1 Tax=Colwellia sp. BRX8-9 TaxID=2759831 RepID=UPI0015F3EF94|nr:oligosaccharide flippase family protein [Colwellia sp. BRX8-9]MBA6348689.1 polysaccharide biosynthesis protein [Colwellia sp. BRX8-9]
MSTTFNRLLSGSILRTISLVITIIISFFMMPFIVHSIGDKWYGLWVLVGSLMGYYMVVDFGLLSATQRYLARYLYEKEMLNKVINTAFCVLCLLSVVAAFFVVVFLYVTPYLVNDSEVVTTMRWLIIILGAKTVLTLPLMVFNGMLSAKLRFDLASYIEISKNILRSILIVVYLTFDYGIVSLALITFICEMCAFVAISLFAVNIYPEANYGKKYFDKVFAKELFKFGKFTFVIETSNLLKSKVDDFVIAKMLGLSFVTTYAIAFSLFTYAGQMVSNLLGGVMTVFSQNDKQGVDVLRQNFLLFAEVCVTLVTFISVFMFLVGEEFILLWMGEDYHQSFDVLVVFIATMLFGSSARATIPLFYATATHKKIAYWNIYEGVLNLCLSIYLTMNFGLIGVALGTFFSSIVFRLLQVSYACSIVELNRWSYWEMIIKHWLYGISMLYILYEISSLFEINSYVNILITCILGTLIYVFILTRYMLSLELKKVLSKNLAGKIPSKLLFFFFNYTTVSES